MGPFSRHRLLQHAALLDDDLFLGLVAAALDLNELYRVHHVHTLGHSPESHVSVVRPPRVVLDVDEKSK